MYGDPAALEELAAVLSRRADEVRQHCDGYIRAGRAAHWVSTAADEYRRHVEHEGVRMLRAADALDDAAAGLRAHAGQVREALAEIARMEHAATEWFEERLRDLRDDAVDAFDAARRGISVLVPEAPWRTWPVTPLDLPGPGDKGWLEVGRFLRRQGVL